MVHKHNSKIQFCAWDQPMRRQGLLCNVTRWRCMKSGPAISLHGMTRLNALQFCFEDYLLLKE
jgi:hypothetical protein